MTDSTLFLQFKLAEDRFVLICDEVIEILPYLSFKPLPKAPAGIAGLIDYRGKPTPLLDLTEIVLGRPSYPRVSTRIIIVNYHDHHNKAHPLGLVAEHAVKTIRRNKSDFVHGGATVQSTPYLGHVLPEPDGIIQWVNAQKLLPPKISDSLFNALVDYA